MGVNGRQRETRMKKKLVRLDPVCCCEVGGEPEGSLVLERGR